MDDNKGMTISIAELEKEPKILDDKRIRNAMAQAMESAQDYAEDGQPIPERNVAESQLRECIKFYTKQMKKLFQELEQQCDFPMSKPKRQCTKCYQAVKQKYLKE